MNTLPAKKFDYATACIDWRGLLEVGIFISIFNGTDSIVYGPSLKQLSPCFYKLSKFES